MDRVMASISMTVLNKIRMKIQHEDEDRLT
jgi:hypothetical protein